MKISVFAAGSRGDIQPCLSLGRGLKAAGYDISMAVPENFSEMVCKHGVNVRPLRGDVQRVMSSSFGRRFLENGGSNPLRSIMAMRKLIGPVVMDMVHDAYEACRDANGLICLGVFSPFGISIAEALHIPLLHIEPTPLLPTKAFPAPSWPVQRSRWGLHNYLSGIVMLYSVWLWYRPFLMDFRRELGLPQRTAVDYYRTLKMTPMISAYSPFVIPHPFDWPPTVHITGDIPLDDAADWHPPKGLQAFLDAGDPPIYIGFGSMTGTDPERLLQMIKHALEKSGQRGLVMTGWSGMETGSHSDRIYMLDHAPHEWIFPRMSALVHHGGAGTIAQGLRAGVPSVIIPFAFDQFFWGERVREQGLGPNPIPRKALTAERLAAAMRIAVEDAGMRKRAADCGAQIRSMDSVANAVEIIKKYFGN